MPLWWLNNLISSSMPVHFEIWNLPSAWESLLQCAFLLSVNSTSRMVLNWTYPPDILNWTDFILFHYFSLSYSIQLLCIFWVMLPMSFLAITPRNHLLFSHLEQVNFLGSHHNLDACVVHRHSELNLPSYFPS